MPRSATPASRPHSYVFGPFRYEPAEHLLLHDRQPVTLPPKAFDLLAALISRAGHLATKEDLLKEVWPDTFVEEANLSYTISLLRKALEDDDIPHRYIETVPRRGYRFIGQIADFTATERQSTGETAQTEPATSGTSAGVRRWSAAILAGIVVLGAAVWLIKVALRADPPARIFPLTTFAGFERGATFSPDGEQVAFAWTGDKVDNVDIYVKIVGSPEVRRLTTDPDLDAFPAWSPDGGRIAFLHFALNGWQIHIMSALGSADRRLSDFSVDGGGIAWSPDGKYIAAPRHTGLAIPHQQNTGIYLIPVQGGEPRQLTRPKPPASDGHPAFSADGRHLAYVSCLRWDGSCDVYVLDLTSALTAASPSRRLTRQASWDVWGLTWSPDQQSLIYDVHIGKLSHLWRVEIDGRLPPERIEVAGLHAAEPAVVASRHRLAFSEVVDDTDIFRFEPGRPPQPLLASSLDDAGGQFSHDGRQIVFSSGRSGVGLEIWVASADGSNVQQLTHGPGPWQGSPDWSPDDLHVAYDSMAPDGRWHIWTIDADGGSPRQITTEPGEQNVPTWSNDGRWIYFSVDQGAGREIWRVPAGGGKVEQVTHGGSGYLARESLDGQSLLYQTGFRGLPLLKMPIHGGPAVQLAECARRSSIVERPEGTYYVRCGEDSELHLLNRKTGSDLVLGKLGDASFEAPASLGVAPDGKSFLFTRQVKAGADLMLIENFR